MALVAVAAALLAAVAGSVTSAPESFPGADTALTSLYTLRALRGDLSVGAYSRYHWNHPGPLLYQILAPAYGLSGHREISLKWMALFVNLACLAGLMSVVRARAPGLELLIAASLVPLLWREQRLLISPWNPLIAVLPLVLALALAASVAAGSVRLLPWLVAVVSFLVQAHVGFAGVSVALTLGALALLWRRMARRDVAVSAAALRRAFIASAVVALALWLVPLVEELGGNPGNLSRITRFFLQAPGGTSEWVPSFVMFSNQLVAPLFPGWEPIQGEIQGAAHAPALALAVAELGLLAAAGFLASRRRNWFAAACCWLSLAASLSGIVAVRSIVGPVSDYLVFWIAALGSVNIAVIAWAVLERRLRAARFDAPRWGVVAALFLASAATVAGVRLTLKHEAEARNPTIRALAVDLHDYCRRNGIDRPLFAFTEPAWQEAMGLVLHFYKHEWPIAVPDSTIYRVGPSFRIRGSEEAEFLMMEVRVSALPGDVERSEWVTTRGIYRIVRVYRRR